MFMSSCSHLIHINQHGGRHSKVRHVGDLSNIITKNGITKGKFYDSYISLNQKVILYCRKIVVVHDKEDDLGQGGDDNLKTGNAGKDWHGIIGLQRC